MLTKDDLLTLDVLLHINFVSEIDFFQGKVYHKKC